MSIERALVIVILAVLAVFAILVLAHVAHADCFYGVHCCRPHPLAGPCTF